MKFLRYLFLILLVTLSVTLLAQQTTSVSVKAQATVVDKSEIELVTIRNLEIDMSLAHDGKIYVSAQRDANAAVMMVKGRADAKFRVKFTPVVEIVNSNGKGTLSLHYEMYGYSTDNQGASEPINAAERTLQIGSDSKYYFWVGGRIDVSNARPGSYDGEFTIEIEYI